MNFHAPGRSIGDNIKKAATAYNDLSNFREYAIYAADSALFFATAIGAVGVGPPSFGYHG